MKTDTIFYQLFKTLPELLFEIIEQPKQLAENYEFKSVELKELKRRIDGVFIPKENSDKPIYFLEVQWDTDEDLYWRLMGESMIYLSQYKPKQDWRAVLLWKTRTLDPGVPKCYQDFLASGKLTIIYLNELKEASSIGLEIIKLIVESEKKAQKRVPQLFERADSEIKDNSLRKEIIDLIDKMLIYKFPKLSRQELEKMFGLSEWKQTKFYQETFAEGQEEGEKIGEKRGEKRGRLLGKIESISNLVKLGLTGEQIAEALDLDIELVRKVINQENN